MKAKLIFDLPDEEEKFINALNGDEMFYAIKSFDQFLRDKIKYGDLPEAENQIYSSIRNEFRMRLEEQNLSIP